jgi:hypothetical protein
MSGQLFINEHKKFSTYDPSSTGLENLIDDFYAAQYESAFGKAAGAVGYGLSSPNERGYFNAIMGKDITVGIFTGDNIYSALGKRAYDHEGVRIQYEQATYGMASEFTRGGVPMFDTTGGDFFVGLGAGTNQDGLINDSFYVPIDDFREPYKDLPLPFDYGMGMQALENKDDTIAYRSYVDKVSANYGDQADKSILRPLWCPQPTIANNNIAAGARETSLQGISRAIASGNEIGKTYNGVTITAGMVSPYGGANGDFAAYRGLNNQAGNAHVENNIDGNVVDLQGNAIGLTDLRKAYRAASVNWLDSANPNGKIWCMSNVLQDKVGALMMANNVLLNTVYAQRTINGVKTIPGRDAGILLNSFNNIPIIQDGNLNFDFSTKKVSTVKMGDCYLLDLKHIWMSMLTPIEAWNFNNIAATRVLAEKNVLLSRQELRTDGYIFHTKIVNIADDA